MSKRFTTTLLEDDFGDLQLTIPYDICEEFGWDQTTEFEYEMSDDGNCDKDIGCTFDYIKGIKWHFEIIE